MIFFYTVVLDFFCLLSNNFYPPLFFFYLQRVVHIALQNLSLTSGSNPLSPSSTSSMDKSHLLVELADVKARLRKLQQEV